MRENVDEGGVFCGDVDGTERICTVDGYTYKERTECQMHDHDDEWTEDARHKAS